MYKYITNIAGIVFLSSLFYVLAIYVEKDLVLRNFVQPARNIELPEWLDSFKIWSIVIITASMISSLIWYALFQWVIKVNDWKSSGKRIIWALFFILPIISVICGILFTKELEKGSWLAYLCYFSNGILCFYVTTALFSPSSFKYAPIGASRLRRWW